MYKKAISYTFIFLFFLSGRLFSTENNLGSSLVYLTWQKDPTTTMTVQWLAEVGKESDDVFYQQEGEKKWSVLAGKHFSIPQNTLYSVHRVELIGLSPDTSYIFRVGAFNRLYKFRTMPKILDKPIRFVVGGDMYHDDIKLLDETNQQAASSNPLFALLGGDIAYASSRHANRRNKNEAKRWLQWIISWNKQMVTPDGYMIPFIPAIGNHDVNGFFDQPKENAPYFYTLFAFPGPQGYNVLDCGDYLSLFVLDTGHTNSIAGAQTLWLQQTMKKKENVMHKFALYHVPAYPSVRKMNTANSLSVRENWVPIFERYKLSAGFENHEHAYKRTYPILKNQVAAQGVLYFGDGAWGVDNPRMPKKSKDTWYLAKALQERHFILVTIDGMNRNFKAIKPSGEILDTYEQIRPTQQ